MGLFMGLPTFTQAQRLLTALLLLALLSGCSTISQQDSKTEEYTREISEQIADLLFKLEGLNKQEPDCNYENFSEDYRQIRVRLNTLLIREQTKLKNTQTAGQVEDLQKSLGHLISMHRDGCLSAGEAIILQKQFNSLVSNIMTLEQAKPQSSLF
ncbi:MAG: hypothetical protein R3E95_09050 [Thiolinea sp.]